MRWPKAGATRRDKAVDNTDQMIIDGRDMDFREFQKQVIRTAFDRCVVELNLGWPEAVSIAGNLEWMFHFYEMYELYHELDRLEDHSLDVLNELGGQWWIRDTCLWYREYRGDLDSEERM